MKKIPVELAIGQRLCHDITEMRDGFKGPAFKRNHIIEKQDIDHLLRLGKKHVFVWDDNIEEIHEDECARRMAAVLSDQNMIADGPSEGKIVLKSSCRGMFIVNRDILAAVNCIKDVTVTCIPNHYPVTKDQRLVSMRIVPLVTEEKNIIEFEKICKDNKMFQVLPYQNLNVAVIITGSEVYSGRITDKFEPIIRKKLANYPTNILGVSVCDDDLEMIKETAKKFINEGADLLIFTGGMSVDPDDLTPTAIKSLGAEIISYGVPSQPGNMTLVAYLGNIAIIGVPGAAISRPTTVFDVLLPHIYTKSQISADDLKSLSEGGLCQLCRNCHFPNCTYGRY